MRAEGFLSETVRNLILVDDQAEQLLDRMQHYVAPDIYKWITEDEV
jgi:predicted Rossmann-fold nucleotide-binding protein